MEALVGGGGALGQTLDRLDHQDHGRTAHHAQIDNVADCFKVRSAARILAQIDLARISVSLVEVPGSSFDPQLFGQDVFL